MGDQEHDNPWIESKENSIIISHEEFMPKKAARTAASYDDGFWQ